MSRSNVAFNLTIQTFLVTERHPGEKYSDYFSSLYVSIYLISRFQTLASCWCILIYCIFIGMHKFLLRICLNIDVVWETWQVWGHKSVTRKFLVCNWLLIMCIQVIILPAIWRESLKHGDRFNNHKGCCVQRVKVLTSAVITVQVAGVDI